MVDHIEIAPEPPTHGIGPSTSIERIGSIVSNQNIVQRIARPSNRGDARQGQVLDIRAQNIRNGTLDRIRPFVRQLRHDIPRIVHKVCVVA